MENSSIDFYVDNLDRLDKLAAAWDPSAETLRQNALVGYKNGVPIYNFGALQIALFCDDAAFDVGDVFIVDGVRLRVVRNAGSDCAGCFYANSDDCLTGCGQGYPRAQKKYEQI